MSSKAMFTEESLVDSLQLMYESVDGLVKEYSDHARDCGADLVTPANDLDGGRADSNSLWRALMDLCTILEECQLTLQLKPSAALGSECVAVDDAPPGVKSCQDGIDSLLKSANVGSVSLDDILKLRMRILRLQRAISNGCNWNETQTGVLIYLSLLPAEPPQEFHQLDISGSEVRRWRAATRGQGSANNEVGDASYYLTLLNAPFNNREPEEYHREKIFVEHRREVVPDYGKAAIGWVPLLDQSWNVLRPQVSALFDNSRAFNFVQWVLELARQTWPSTFGLEAVCAGPQIEFANALCTGTITPLHVAAALGMSGLCQDLLSRGYGVKDNGPLGTPLMCALLGLSSFEDRLGEQSWHYPRDELYSKPDRAKTILVLLDAGADCKIRYNRRGDSSSMMFLAGWVSFVTQNEQILRRMDFDVGDYDEGLEQLLQFANFHPQNAEEKTSLSRIVTYIIDSYIKIASGNLINLDLDALLYKLIEDTVQIYSLDFPCLGPEPSPLDALSAKSLYSLIELTVLQSQTFVLGRLVKCPRFDPNPAVSNDRDTLLHIAVSADSEEMVNMLVDAGANLGARDRAGRPPLLVVESDFMLMTLVTLGAPTTDTDWSGRNIWHLAAATNDTGLLRWLCRHDDHKQKNLETVTARGCSPLAEAFLLIEGLASQPEMAGYPAQPNAARMLLEECRTKQSLTSRVPLPHVAAEWGDLDLINRLASLGADFNELSKDGRSALHCVNFSASAEVIRRLQELCGWITPPNEFGCPTPAETIFGNFKPVFGESATAMSSRHPSCRRVLSKDAYSLLLTRSTIESVDLTGACLWKRFCDRIVAAGDICTRYARSEGAPVLYLSMIAAMECLIDTGVMKYYEKRNNLSAVLALLPSPEQLIATRPRWSMDYYHSHIFKILQNGSADLLKEFALSREAMYFIIDAISFDNPALVDFLIAKGAVVFDPDAPDPEDRDGSNPSTPLEWMTTHSNDSIAYVQLLKHVTAEQLTRGRLRILRALVQTEDGPVQQKKLAMLLKKGLDLNTSVMKPGPVQNDADQPFDSTLALAIENGYPEEVCMSFLRSGADPRGESGNKNAAMLAVDYEHRELLLEIIKIYGDDFPWSTANGGWVNILNVCVFDGDNECLELLLKGISCRFLINELVRNWQTEDLDILQMLNDINAQPEDHPGRPNTCLEMMIEQGMDIEMRDENLQTILHHLCISVAEATDERTGDFLDLFKVLVQSDPRLLLARDNDEKTPLDFLAEFSSRLSLYWDFAMQHLEPADRERYINGDVVL